MPYNILVVDDEPDLELMMKQKFRKQIKADELHFKFACNGVDALNQLSTDGDVDLILTDINMPEMDGLTLLLKLKEMKTITKAVVVSAYGDMDNIRIAMNRGAFDFLTKPLDFTDLDVTMTKTFEELQQVKQAILFKNQLLTIQKELDIAWDIQQSMLPPAFKPSSVNDKIELIAAMKPAKEVGGDLYDYFYMNSKGNSSNGKQESKLAFVLGDVSGKGVPSAMFMAMSRMLLKSTALNVGDPAECITHVNRILSVESISTMFVTLFYGILDVNTGEVEFVNAGHNPPYIIKQNGGLITLSNESQIALGVVEGYNFTSGKFKLEPCDTFFLFTDGVTEAFNKEEDLYGEKRLEEKLTEFSGNSTKDIINKVIEDVKLFSAGAPQSDDITVMGLRYNK
ncbi:MAG: SpoIIE family protein phosphatase [Ignavibacteriaceae bacterium]